MVDIPVYEQTGLAQCWNVTTDQFDNRYRNYICKEYVIPVWLEPVTTLLWILLGIDIFIAVYWMHFMWNNQRCREAIFKFADDRDPKNIPLPGQSVWSCCCLAVNLPKRLSCCETIYDKTGSYSRTCYGKCKKCLGLPDQREEAEVSRKYNYYTDVIKSEVEEDDIIFGHKAFFWPLKKPKYTMSTKKRLTFTLTVMYAPILALLIDFICDIQYLNQISKFSNRNLLDKHIHIDTAALVVVAVWDVFSFFTIPLTCSFVYKLSFTENLKANLMGEVLIINVSYLLEDGVELMMQYYYFDKYAGVRYEYFETDGIINIFFSAMISFTLAVFNIFALSHLFVQLKKNGFGSLKSKVFSILMFSVGLIPLVAMFCRVIASFYQIFTFNKYRDGCLHYETNDSLKQLIVRQAALFNFDCYRAIDWPLIFGNFIGIGLHCIMAILLLIEHYWGTPETIAIIKRNSILENAKSVEHTETENQEVMSNGPYYSLPPNEQSLNNGRTSSVSSLEELGEPKRSSTHKPISFSEMEKYESKRMRNETHDKQTNSTRPMKSAPPIPKPKKSELNVRIQNSDACSDDKNKSQYSKKRSVYVSSESVNKNDKTWI